MYRDEMSSPNHIIKAWKRCEIRSSKPLILILILYKCFTLIIRQIGKCQFVSLSSDVYECIPVSVAGGGSVLMQNMIYSVSCDLCQFCGLEE